MEPSKENKNEFDDNDENSNDSVKSNFGVNDDEQTNKTAAIKNVNELRVLDYHSADDVRQSIKSAIASKGLFTFGTQLPTPKIMEISIKPIPDEAKENNVNTEVTQQSEERVNLGGNNPKQNRSSNLKRRGRPVKTGPPKRPPKRYKIDDFYIGKLSNFVPYKRNGESESDFDSESSVLY